MEVPTKRSQKVLNPQQPTEKSGLIFVQQIAHAIQAIWRPTPNDDYGFDGELELTHAGTVTGYILKVQVKSGGSYMRNRTAGGFDFYVEPSDATYWRQTNVPVILVVYDPTAMAGYWVDVKRYMREHEEFTAESKIRFSFRSNVLTAESFLDLSETAIPDEVNRTEYLVDKIKESLHSNMLPVIGVPGVMYEAEFSAQRMAEAAENGITFAKQMGGKYLGFRDPAGAVSPLRSYIDLASVKQLVHPEYLRRSGTRNFAVGRWNDAIRIHMQGRGLIQKDDETFYFPPESGNLPRKIVWESMRGRTPERQVAYPYMGKQSQAVVFWVHHACRVAFCEIGGYFFLRLVPAYVFTRDGIHLIAGKEAGTLSTHRARARTGITRCSIT